MIRTSTLPATALVAAVLLQAPVARGAEVQINPVLIHLSPSARSALVVMKNVATSPVRFEIQVHAWSQSPAGEMLLSPTEDIVAYPPILTLGPGEERNLRIAAATAFGAVEKTYRVFVQELPGTEGKDSPAQVRVLSRIGLPVFLAPSRSVAKSRVEDLHLSMGKVAFRLRNEGTQHLRPSSVKLAVTGAGGERLLEKDLDAWYVLAAGERDYQVELPAVDCPRARELSVTVMLGSDVVKGRAPVDAGGCGW